MSNIADSIGEGVDPSAGDEQHKVTKTGYGIVYLGGGNVSTHAEDQKGTGYDEHHQVSTGFGKFPIKYDPVTGCSVSANFTTAGYSFPGHDLNSVVAGHTVGSDLGGLVDISATPIEVGTVVDEKKEGKRESGGEERSA